MTSSFRAALVKSLSSLGYRSDGYASAEDYLRAVGGGSFDCVVTDIHMPGISGLDLMKHLAAEGSKTPIVAITARSDIEPGGQSRRRGSGVSAQEAI